MLHTGRGGQTKPIFVKSEVFQTSILFKYSANDEPKLNSFLDTMAYKITEGQYPSWHPDINLSKSET